MANLELIEEVSNLEEGEKPNPEKRIGRKCYAFSPTEDKAFALIESKTRNLFTSAKLAPEDYEIKTDALGNLFITYFGMNRDRSIMSGSHADSVLNGGKYDGMAGVNSAFNFLSDLVGSGKKPAKNFTMVVFRAEESSPKTGVACLGSRISTGTITAEELEKINYKLDNGTPVSLHQYFDQHYGPEKWGQVLEEIKNPPITDKNTDAFEELHIEQSGVILTNDADVGIVVDGIGGAIRESVTIPIKPEMKRFTEITPDKPHIKVRFSFKGEEAHTGGTPPNPRLKRNTTDVWYRKDALFAASEFARLFFRLAQSAGLDKNIMLKDFSMPQERGFTTVPPEQNLEICIPAFLENMEISRIAGQCVSRITENTGVKISITSIPSSPGEIVHYDHSILKSFQIPVAMERIIRQTVESQKKESGGVGRIRGTVTDFRICPEKEGQQAVKFNLDFRDVDTATILNTSDEVHKKITAVFPDMVPEIKTVAQKKYTPVDEEAVQTKRNLAAQLNLKTVEMPSLPGQDAENLGKIGIKTSMTFIGHDGKSHNPEETIGPTKYAAAEKLSHAYLRRMVGLDS